MMHTESNPPIILCPVCGSDGTALRHSTRCSLLYFCDECWHEWQIDPADEPSERVPAQSPGPPKGER
jgi:hypothetical protein